MMSIATKWIASAAFSVIAILSCCPRAYSLDETEKIAIAVYEHEIGKGKGVA
jgi:hypothetical protein